MRTLRPGLGVVVFFALAAVACGGSDGSDAATTGAGGASTGTEVSTSVGTMGAGAGTSTSTTSTHATTTTTSTSTSVTSTTTATTTTSTGAGGGALASNPPPTTTLCGSGVLMAADVASACAMTPMGSGQLPQDCGAITTNGGRWEAWCGTGTLAYVWLELDQASTTQASCFGGSAGDDPVNVAGGNQSATLPGMAEGQGFLTGTPSDVAYGLTIDFDEGVGTGNMWIASDLMCGPGDEHAALVAGAAFHWHAP